MQKIKINFSVSEESKKKLDEIRAKTQMSNSNIIDTLLAFDNESAEFFLETFKGYNKQLAFEDNYLMLKDGGIIFDQNTMNEIFKSMHLKKVKESDNDAITEPLTTEELTKKIEILENAVVVVHKQNLGVIEKNKKLEKSVEDLKNVFKNIIEIK